MVGHTTQRQFGGENSQMTTEHEKLSDSSTSLDENYTEKNYRKEGCFKSDFKIFV